MSDPYNYKITWYYYDVNNTVFENYPINVYNSSNTLVGSVASNTNTINLSNTISNLFPDCYTCVFAVADPNSASYDTTDPNYSSLSSVMWKFNILPVDTVNVPDSNAITYSVIYNLVSSAIYDRGYISSNDPSNPNTILYGVPPNGYASKMLVQYNINGSTTPSGTYDSVVAQNTGCGSSTNNMMMMLIFIIFLIIVIIMVIALGVWGYKKYQKKKLA